MSSSISSNSNSITCISKIVSGGQTGADRAGLDFAIAHNLPHGGFCPKGRKSEDGIVPEIYQLKETLSDSYTERTRLNVKKSNATVIFSQMPLGKGSKLTVKNCEQQQKRYCILDTFSPLAVSKLKDFLNSFQHPIVLNVAGSRESNCTGISQKVQAIFCSLVI